MAFITSWATFSFKLDCSEESGIQSHILHLPCMLMPSIMDVAIVFRPYAEKLAVIYLAKGATPEALTNSTSTILGSTLNDAMFP